MVADRKGKVLGLGAPPAKEMRDGGERCCSSAWRRSDTGDKGERKTNEETRTEKSFLETRC